jgi:hypothetical protein
MEAVEVRSPAVNGVEVEEATVEYRSPAPAMG